MIIARIFTAGYDTCKDPHSCIGFLARILTAALVSKTPINNNSPINNHLARIPGLGCGISYNNGMCQLV
jgi:hypothetical protein